jgi:hypothetical protein
MPGVSSQVNRARVLRALSRTAVAAVVVGGVCASPVAAAKPPTTPPTADAVVTVTGAVNKHFKSHQPISACPHASKAPTAGFGIAFDGGRAVLYLFFENPSNPALKNVNLAHTNQLAVTFETNPAPNTSNDWEAGAASMGFSGTRRPGSGTVSLSETTDPSAHGESNFGATVNATLHGLTVQVPGTGLNGGPYSYTTKGTVHVHAVIQTHNCADGS